MALPAWLQNVPIGGWVQIANTAILSVQPSPLPPAGTGPQAKVIAWCGMALDTRDSTLWCVANGGHTDYSGNEVDAIRLSDAAPAWQQRLAPTPAAQIISDALYYADGRPTSRHTYYSEHFILARNRIMMFGVGARYGNSGFSANATDGYNVSTNTYDPQGTFSNVPSVAGAGNLTGVVHSITNDVYFLSDVVLQKWTQATNTWSTVNNLPIGSFYTCAAFDSTRLRALFIDNSATPVLYTPASNTFTNPGFTGPNAGSPNNGGQQGIQYVPALDAYLVQSGSTGGTVLRINASTLSVDTFPTTGGSSIPSTTSVGTIGVFTRWQYCPQLGGIVYCPDYNSSIWFLRIHAVSTQMPGSPLGLVVQ